VISVPGGAARNFLIADSETATRFYISVALSLHVKVTLLGLLDLSAAFDTVDHVILLRRLEESFGLGGSVLEWFRSFIAYRSQAVTFHGVTSDYTPLLHGVPQGSVLGPLLFILYTADVALFAAQHGVDLHSYADDTQLYTGCSSTDASNSAV